MDSRAESLRQKSKRKNEAMPEILTATQLRLLAMCERRVWLDKFGDPSQRDDVSGRNFAAFQRGIEHEATIHATTSPNLITIHVETWQDYLQETQKAIERGVTVLINAAFEVLVKLDGKQEEVLFRGKIDRLERHIDGFYYPIEIKQYKQLNEADLLQLDFYCFLLGQIQGNIPNGEFWLSSQASGFPEQKIAHTYNPERLQLALFRWVNLFRFKKPPKLIYESHCRKCHWQSFCVDELKNKNRIELLHNLRKNSRQALKEKGIFTLEQLVTLSVEELGEIKGIKTTAVKYKAQAQAYINKTPVQYAEISPRASEKGIMFDLETDTNWEIRYFHSWCMGWSNTEGDTNIIIVNSQHDKQNYILDGKTEIHIVQTPEAAWSLLYEQIKESDTPIFHWTKYDATTLKKTAPKQVQEALLPRMHDLADSFTKSVQLPIRSYSIKEVARYFGFKWQRYENWQRALWDYTLWKNTGDYQYLERAASYQRDDVLSMLVVWQWMNKQAKGGVSPA
jgi:predicted RecB family nuclease